MAKKKVTIDDLARMTQQGFLEIGEKIQKGFENSDKHLRNVETDIKDLKNGQERIELRLTNVAYRFELVALDERVKFLEK